MLTFAKGVGNGITLAGVVARAEIMDTIDVAVVLDLRRQPAVGGRRAGHAALRARPRPAGQRPPHGCTGCTTALAPVVDATDWIAELRGKGLMQAIEIVHPGGIEPDTGRAAAVLEAHQGSAACSSARAGSTATSSASRRC